MGTDSGRLDGWKAIGGHFGRDRTTVIRWSKERGLPVHALPGGKNRTVYALRDELDAWVRSQGGMPPAATPEPAAEPVPDEAPPPEETPPDPPATPAAVAPRPPARRVLAAVVVAAVLLGVALLALRGPPPRPAKAAGADIDLPADPAVAALYLRGVDAAARRTPASLDEAVALFATVTRRAPHYAPGFAGLADAYILSREYGPLGDAIAFERARRAADQARRIDPTFAAPYRVDGFVAYWWDRDLGSAERAFAEALRRDPHDARTRLWYGNVLADAGDFSPALGQLAMARMLDPGSAATLTDQAWALWSAGHVVEAEAQLDAIARDNPGLASVHDCLSVVRLAAGDYRGYLRELRLRAGTRREAELNAYADSLDHALARGGVEALPPMIFARAMAMAANAPVPDHAWAAFVASVAGDRAHLLTVLQLADSQGERWGSAGFTTRIARAWAGDPAITRLIARVAHQTA